MFVQGVDLVDAPRIEPVLRITMHRTFYDTGATQWVLLRVYPRHRRLRARCAGGRLVLAGVVAHISLMTDVRHVLTILAVADVRRAAAFYVEAFGWARTVDVPVYTELALPSGMRLGVYERHAFAANTGRVPTQVARGEITATELYLRCGDLDVVLARVLAAGGRLLAPRARRDWGDDVAYVADLDGNVLALAMPRPQPAV